MPLSREHLEILAEKRLKGTITPEEQVLLEDWLNQEPEEKMFWDSSDVDEQALRKRLLARIKQDAGMEQPVTHVHNLYTKRWWWAAAAVLIIGLGSYIIFFNQKPADHHPPFAAKANDITAPVKNRAIITMANGKTVYLDSAANGTLATQGNVQIVKLADGQIAYEGSTSEVVYNTLTNPRGSKVIDITLSDGSHVWLNAGSSLTYPIAFVGNERKVSITGEAYFEVAHDQSKPFLVSKDKMEVQVLGTHFNVNAYDDESDIKVTLLEGKVKVRNEGGSVTIKPGQQAKLNSNRQPVTSNPDLDEVMAWKNGRFLFTGADLKTIMRQVMRWYDVDIVYENNVPERYFTADISRNTNLSELLKVLELSKIHFKIEGKKLTVMP